MVIQRDGKTILDIFNFLISLSFCCTNISSNSTFDQRAWRRQCFVAKARWRWLLFFCLKYFLGQSKENMPREGYVALTYLQGIQSTYSTFDLFRLFWFSLASDIRQERSRLLKKQRGWGARLIFLVFNRGSRRVQTESRHVLSCAKERKKHKQNILWCIQDLYIFQK